MIAQDSGRGGSIRMLFSGQARSSGQSFFEANAYRTPHVLTKGRNIDVSHRPIETDCLRLTPSSFKPQRQITKVPGFGLQCGQELSRDTPPAPCRLHEHPLYFADTRFQFTNRSATDCFAIGVCDEENKPVISNVFWTKAVQGYARISSTQVIVERSNEANGISRIRPGRRDFDR